MATDAKVPAAHSPPAKELVADVNGESSAQLVAAASVSATFAADFVSSWVGYVSALSIAHPLDTVRVRWQTRGLSPFETLRTDSVKGLYSGIVGPAVANGPLVACIFAMNETYRACARWFNVHCLGNSHLAFASHFTVAELAVAGAAAGASASVFMCPVSVVRIQQQIGGVHGEPSPSMVDVCKRLYAAEGMAGFYRALPYEAMASGVGRMAYFTSYEVTKASLETALPDVNDTLRMVVAASLTSVVGWASCFPLDVIKNRLQADAINQSSKQYRGFSHCCAVTYRSGGVRAFWTGFSLTILRSCVSSGISLPVYDTMKPRLRAAIPGSGS
jgi:solute carrier family 25 carnitine/acylcarnitine transporter 20/29